MYHGLDRTDWRDVESDGIVLGDTTGKESDKFLFSARKTSESFLIRMRMWKGG
jgi:hypothetical protein